MKRIVCIGNRYLGEDDAGPKVHDVLCSRKLPDGVEVLDGGLAGLNLLPCFDGATGLVFVDAVAGFGAPGSVHVLEAEEVAALADGQFDHAAGLPYLLRAATAASEGPLPRVVVVGVEMPADGESLEMAAEYALRAVAEVGENLVLSERGVA